MKSPVAVFPFRGVHKAAAKPPLEVANPIASLIALALPQGAGNWRHVRPASSERNRIVCWVPPPAARSP